MTEEIQKYEGLNIYQKMLKITEETEAIPKNGWNDFSKYKYVRAIDLIGHVKKLLVKYGVHLDVKEDGIQRTLEGKNFHTQISCVGVFTNSDNPSEQITVPYWSVSADTLDKDIFKAKTNGLKYLLSQTFKIITDDFIDTETSGKETPDQNEPVKITEKQLEEIKTLSEAWQKWILTAYKKDRLEDLTQEDYNKAKVIMKAKADQKKTREPGDE